MGDFFAVRVREGRKEVKEVYADFLVKRSKDLMVLGGAFYAVWDPEFNLWSTDEYRVAELVDAEIRAKGEALEAAGEQVKLFLLGSHKSKAWSEFKTFVRSVSDHFKELDSELTFLDTPTTRTSYASKRLPYSMSPGSHPAWTELTTFLYAPEELKKIEWTIGAIMSGEAKKIEKFSVFFGAPGTGKSTVLKIIEKLCEGYVTFFDARALVTGNNQFATEPFKNNPLVAIEHDSDLSKIDDASRLHSIISHEMMNINEKFKSQYKTRFNAFLLIGTNKTVKIADANSGLIRRVLDIHPTGKKLEVTRYFNLMKQIDFELGAIAAHCLEVYHEVGGKSAYEGYEPTMMMMNTDPFLNYVDAHFDVFAAENGITLTQAWKLYKVYAEETGLEYKVPQYKFRDRLKSYFEEFHRRTTVNGVQVWNYYEGLKVKQYKAPLDGDKSRLGLVLDKTESLLDERYKDMPAQYPNSRGWPRLYWNDGPRINKKNGEIFTPGPDQIVSTKLSDIDTTQLHYVQIPENEIVIDFDLTDENGNKSLELNLEAAAQFPPTYAELSKSGKAVHLHYVFDGPVEQLASNFAEGIEVKTLLGDSGLRRRLTYCNDVPIATISSGLPYKEHKTLNETPTGLKDERHLRNLMDKALRKEIQNLQNTKPIIDFLKHITDRAYNQGLKFDIMDMQSRIINFAARSSNQQIECLRLVSQMHFEGKEPLDVEMAGAPAPTKEEVRDKRLVFFDIEVYPNYNLVCWSFEDEDEVHEIECPTPQQAEWLLGFLLVGFNNLHYDNHILYAMTLGWTPKEIYELSRRIVKLKDRTAKFKEAFGISYADVLEFSTVKMTLKEFEVLLGILHMEMDLDWDEPIKDRDKPRIIAYCKNDVTALKEVFKSRAGDWQARQILAELTGLSVNDTTQKHTGKFVFGNTYRPQSEFVYTKLETKFPGYKFYEFGDKEAGIPAKTAIYRGEQVNMGGYVYAKPGIYRNVVLLDVASMHPTSMKILNIFGDEYTKRFYELVEARLAIKHKDFDKAAQLLDGRLAKYLGDPAMLKPLSDALKIVINIVYGLTAAKFDNQFKDDRNVDNIVAKHGALFMIDLKNALQDRGCKVIHIKTDSVKIADATDDDIEFVKAFGKQYGYDFEHEVTFDRICLVNDAVYIGHVGWNADDKPPYWTATGAEFQHPYIFKTLFTHEGIEPNDLFEAKSVKGSARIFMDFSHHEDPSLAYEGGGVFVGRTGMFVPVKPHSGGAHLVRRDGDKDTTIAGTKGYDWLEARAAMERGMDVIDMSYYEKLVDNAMESIKVWGDPDEFIAGYSDVAA